LARLQAAPHLELGFAACSPCYVAHAILAWPGLVQGYMGKRSEAKRSEDTIRWSKEVHIDTLAEAARPAQFRSTLEFWRAKESHAVLEHRKPRPFVLQRNNTAPHMRHPQVGNHSTRHVLSPRILKREPRHRRVESLSTCSLVDSSISPRIDDLLSDDDDACSSDEHGRARARPSRRGGSPVGVGSSLKAEAVELVEKRLRTPLSGTPLSTPRVSSRSCLGSVTSVKEILKHSMAAQSSALPAGPQPHESAAPDAGGDSPQDLRSSQWLEVESRWQAALRQERPVTRRPSIEAQFRSESKGADPAQSTSSASRRSASKEQPTASEAYSDLPVPVTWEAPSRCSSMSGLDCLSLGSRDEPVPVTWQAPSRSSSLPSLDRMSLVSSELPVPVTWEAPSRTDSLSRNSSPRSMCSSRADTKEEATQEWPLPRWPAIDSEAEFLQSSSSNLSWTQTSQTASSSNLSLGWSRSYAKLPGIASS